MTTPGYNDWPWRSDFENAPRGRTIVQTRIIKGEPRDIQVFVPEYVILASTCGKVIKSHWLPDPGRWEFFNKDSQPDAWMPWPDHPAKGKVRA